MKRNRNEPAMREAADWILASEDRPLTRRERGQLADWLRGSPDNVREYLEASTVWNDMAHVDADRNIDVVALCEPDNVVPFPEAEVAPNESTFLRRHSGKLVAVAASLATVATLVFHLHGGGDDAREVATGLGEQRSVLLDDGSIVHLNTLSNLRIDFGSGRRGVELVAGEALFAVVRDAHRPFAVRVGAAEIEVTGTRFNVRRREGLDVVTVVEGVVEAGPVNRNVATDPGSPVGLGGRTGVEPVEVAAGHQVEFDHSGRAGPVTKVRTDQAIAWTERRLVFDGDTLDTIAHEFNRYNARKLRVLDPEVGSLRLSGVFASNDPESLAEYLRTMAEHPIEVEYTEGTITLSRRPD